MRTTDRMRFAVAVCLPLAVAAEVAGGELENQSYYPESDAAVLAKLERWQDAKFGLMMHWGPYSQWGIVESWSLCSEDEDWCRRKDEDYNHYKAAYEKLPETFNPTRFDPRKWARAGHAAGMKYVVFTTKHHDGFCMFDTKQTDYKITADTCSFHTNPKADITKGVFEAFRAESFMIGAYFSKPDWHSPDYWWPRFATPDRNPNYDLTKYPKRWERFVRFTHNQIDELMTNYGGLDILWLDGGWVQVLGDADLDKYCRQPGFKQTRPQSQDIRMGEIVAKARAKQPGLIVVDRAVEGPHQNYLTPENRIPDRPVDVPWESVMTTSSGGWSYVPGSKYITGRDAIHRLLDVVSKGGNLLLNFAPSPEGDFDAEAYALLSEIGDWMAVNGEAIFNTRATTPHQQDHTGGRLYFTRSKNEKTTYIICLGDERAVGPPAEIRVRALRPVRGMKVEMLGRDEPLCWADKGDGFAIRIPQDIIAKPPCRTAWTFRIDY